LQGSAGNADPYHLWVPRKPMKPTRPNPTDRELARRMAAGDQRALKEVATLYGSRVRAVLVKRYGEWEDAYSIALMRLWAVAGRYEPEKAALPTWFTAIALRCGFELLEERKRQLPQEWLAGDKLTWEPERPPTLADLAAPASTESRDLLRVIDGLPELQRKVIRSTLYKAPGQRDSDLAKELGTTALTVRVSRSKAIRTIRAALGAFGRAAGSSEGNQ
jgi:RNA polymerase sigma-70 factor, ECF subfamily